MKATKSIKFIAIGLGAVVLGTVGCATKKYVRQSVEPLETHLKTSDQKIADNGEQIRSVDRRAESGIAEAQNSAQQANQAAGQADQHAQAAHQVAEQGVAQANQAQEMVNNIDNYKPAQHATVLFAFNKSNLTDTDKQDLDQLVQAVKPMKHYVIQVRGFTDTTGSKAYNLQLSERRADSVVRYLTLNGDIPLVKIHNLGYGEEAPVSSNHTRQGRKENRRVDVTVFVPQMPGQENQQSQASAGPGTNQ